VSRRVVRIRIGWLPLIFGMAVVWVALAGLLYVIQTIAHATAVLLEIGATPHG
jgi:hypothetical protein